MHPIAAPQHSSGGHGHWLGTKPECEGPRSSRGRKAPEALGSPLGSGMRQGAGSSCPRPLALVRKLSWEHVLGGGAMRAMSSTRYHGPRGVLRPTGGLRSTGWRPPGGERAWPQGEFPSAPPTPTSQGKSHRQGAGENPGQAPAGRGIPEANDPSVTLAVSRRTPCAVNITGKGRRRSAGGGSRRRDFRVSTRLWPHGGGKAADPDPQVGGVPGAREPGRACVGQAQA